MDASELESYREQVASIETALQADPNNTELQILKTELLDLISLTESLQQQQQQQEEAAAASPLPSSTAAASVISSVRTSPSVTSSPSRSSSSPYPSTTTTSTLNPSGIDPSKQPIYQPPPPPSRQWAVGDKCRALYAADGRYYEATILSIGGGGQVYSVQYKGYESSAPGVVGPQDLKTPHDPKKYQKNNAATAVTAAAAAAGGTNEGEKKKRGAEESAGGAGSGGGGAKKKKNTGPSEQVQKQQAWQSFAKGAGGKKTKGAAPILKKSIFASPDNPEGKVGVVGSGKGMTQFQQRGKHVYGQSQQDTGN